MHRARVDFAKIPDEPGVYFFHRGTNIQYVGKATSLRSRVRSYFDPDLALKRSPVVAKVVEDATKITWKVADSVLEALLMEANFIKELKPIGNTMDKDDKSFNYVVITSEPLPRVLTMRGRELAAKIAPALRKKVYGPFTQGGSLKEALKIIRRIFPYFDTKFPVDYGHPTSIGRRMSSGQIKTLRFNQSIGLYPSEDRAVYLRTIRNLMYLFEGKKKALITAMERDMRQAAKNEAFEEADTLKRQLFALNHIRDIALLKDEFRAPRTNGYRIEAYDTAHLRGSATRAVMTVVTDGEADTNEYRIFTIRTAVAGDDYQALREVLERRFNHPEWPHPQLIVIDGGRAHLKVASDTLKKLKLSIEVCAVVKDKHHKAREILGKRATSHNHKSSILLANSEAHRFSIGRHRMALRKKSV